nr:retrovirus-related Pol polyprotein from transposon TNT 1-94 [Tanacetum cinerariifolium]
MVAFLEKSKGCEGFHKILDFLNSTHIKYALTVNPIIYVSLIHQLWETAFASTLEDGKMKITATIDGRMKTITKAFIKRHLKLEDSNGITTLPNAKIFKQLALMGVEDLQSDLQQKKLTYGAAYTKLILRVKKLEHKVETSQHRTRTRVVLSTDEEDLEDPSKQGRKIVKIDENPFISLVQNERTSWIQEDYEIQGRTSADTEILLDQEEPTELVEDLVSGEMGEKEISTVIPEVSTAAENLVYIRRSPEKRKDKGKAIMKEDKSIQKKSKKQLEQEILRHEKAIRLQEHIFEEEIQRIARDAKIAKRLQEAIAEADSAHDIDWNDPAVLRYHTLQNRSFSIAEDGSSSKPVRGSRKKIVAKKRIGAKLDEESAKRQKLKDVIEEEATVEYENKKEELRLSLKIIHNDDSEVNYEPLSRKFAIVSWENQLSRKIEAKDMKELWMNQLDWKSLRWKLRENYGVHALLMDGARMKINMLVEKKYHLIKELLEKMLILQLEAKEERIDQGLGSTLNVTFDETRSPSKTSPLVDDDLDEEEAIKVIEKKNLEKDMADETLEIDEIVNIKESRNHPLKNVIGNLNQRTLRSQAQNKSNFFCFISTIEPKNVNEALGDESWIVAMQEEFNQFVANDVWELFPQHRNMKIIETKWVYRNKLDENGIVFRNKARLVAQGYNQQEGIDYDENYAPVARLESIRILLAYACTLDFKLFQMDAKSAFLNGFINEEVYMAQPSGFTDFEKPNHVYKLKKALYGLKQAPKSWYDRLKAFLIKHKYKIGMVDTTLFTKKKSSNLIIVQIYVDDIIFGLTCQDVYDEFSKIMHDEFEMRMMGELNFSLGLQIKQMEDGIFFNQSKYIKEMLKKFSLEDSKPMKTPCPPISNSQKMKSMSRVCLCARFKDAPKTSQLEVVKRIFRHINSTTHLGCCLTSWFSKKQTALAISTTEAEYVSTRKACQQVLWMKQALIDYDVRLDDVPIMYDIKGAINLSKNPMQHSRTKLHRNTSPISS